MTSDEPGEGSSGEFRGRHEASDPIRQPDGDGGSGQGGSGDGGSAVRGASASGDDAPTGIIRRHPSGPIPQPVDDARTSIIRRQPVGSTLADDAPTTMVRGAGARAGIGRQVPRRIAGAPPTPSAASAVTAATFNIVSGWATAVIATGLITGWWRTDRLFCVGVGFLTAVCGAAIITGVTQLLLRRRVGIYLTLVGAALAVLIFAGIFVAGAHVSGVVRALPVLPGAATLFALLPPTWRWTRR